MPHHPGVRLTLVVDHADQCAGCAEAAEFPGGRAGGADHQVRFGDQCRQRGGGRYRSDGLPPAGGDIVDLRLDLGSPDDDREVHRVAGGHQHPGQDRRRADRVGAAEEGQHPGAADRRGGRYDRRPGADHGVAQQGVPAPGEQPAGQLRCGPRPGQLRSEVLVEVEVRDLAPAVAVDDGEGVDAGGAQGAGPGRVQFVGVEDQHVQVVSAGRLDQFGRRVRAGEQRDAPRGQLRGCPVEPFDGAEHGDVGAPGEELLGERQAADEVADAAPWPGVAAQPDPQGAQDSSRCFCRTSALSARSRG
ncbi:hypothetical protein PSN01_04894 [Micromonospora saelicesensis]|nr:hypothetical protein PSN01_04894 [Micromonospora saelicesensis]